MAAIQTTSLARPARVIELDARHPSAGDGFTGVSPEAAAELIAWRDRLTRDRLTGPAVDAAGTSRIRFRRHWWDGASYVPTAVVRRRGGRVRVVESRGEVLTLPAGARSARRTLRRLRRPAPRHPGLALIATWRGDPPLRPVIVRDDLPVGVPTPPPAPVIRAGGLIVIDQGDDGVRCGHRGCAALIPVPGPGHTVGPGSCPQCGRSTGERSARAV